MGKGDGRRVEDPKKIDANWEKVFPPKKRCCEVCSRVLKFSLWDGECHGCKPTDGSAG